MKIKKNWVVIVLCLSPLINSVLAFAAGGAFLIPFIIYMNLNFFGNYTGFDLPTNCFQTDSTWTVFERPIQEKMSFRIYFVDYDEFEVVKQNAVKNGFSEFLPINEKPVCFGLNYRFDVNKKWGVMYSVKKEADREIGLLYNRERRELALIRFTY